MPDGARLAGGRLLGCHGQYPATQGGRAPHLDLGAAQAEQKRRQIDQIALAERHVAEQIGLRGRPKQADRARPCRRRPER